MKRKLLAILTAVCMTATFVGGSATVWAAQEESAAKDEVIVTMPTTSEPEAGFDPAYGWGAGEHVHEPLIQSTLTVTNKDLSIGMDLATDYSVSEDGLTWTVKIRDDVKFTDGEPLTAEDVAFTYNNCRDNSSVNDFSMLKEAVAVDDTTVEFHMNTPFAVWPYTMAIVGIVPEHAYDENYGQNPIGSGRYIMKQWDKGQQVIFEANPDYYGEAPTMKKVTVLFMEEDAALAAAQSGTVDVAHTAASYSDMSVDGYDLFSVQTVDNRGFNLPATAAEEIDGVTYGNDFTSDVEVRRAINIGIDRDEMIRNVLNGYGTPAYSVCDKMPWYNEEAEVEYDQDKAKELLEAAGWEAGDDGIREKDGKKLVVKWLTYPSRQELPLLAESAQATLKDIGIEVDINCTADNNSILEDPTAWDVYAMANVQAPTGDPEYWFTVFATSDATKNSGKYSSAKLDELEAQLSKEFDEDKRAELAVQMQQTILDDNAFVFCSFLKMSMISRSNVTGYESHACDYYQVTADLDIN